MKNLLIFVIESIISNDVQNPVSRFEGPLYIESTVNCRIEFWKSDSGLVNHHKPEKIELYNFRGIHPDGTKARDLSLSKMIQFLIINRNLIGAIKMEFEDKNLAAKIYMNIESEAKKNQIIIGNDIYIKRPSKKENPTSRRIFEMMGDLEPYGLRKKGERSKCKYYRRIHSNC